MTPARRLPDFSATADDGVRFDPHKRQEGDVSVVFRPGIGAVHASALCLSPPPEGVAKVICRGLQREARSIRAVDHGDGWTRIADATNRSENPRGLAYVDGMTPDQVNGAIAYLVRIDWVFPLADPAAWIAELQRGQREREAARSAKREADKA